MGDQLPVTSPEPARLMSPKAALSVANSVLGGVLGTMALVYIAQNLGPSVLGVLGYAMVTIGIMSFLSDFGVGSVHAMHIRTCKDVPKCIGAYASIRLVLVAIFAVVTFVLIELWKDGLVGGSMPSNRFMVDALIDSMYVFLVYYILLGISQIATHTFDALDAYAKVYVPSILELVVRVSFIVYIATTALGSGANAPALLASAYAAGIIASMLLVSVLVSRYRIAMPDRAILSSYISSLVPVFFISVTIIIDLYLDKAVVGYFWGETEMGLYFGVQRMAVFVGVFSLSVATIILPSVTAYFIRKEVGASWELVNQAERYVSLVVVPTAAFYLFYGSDMLRVFLGDAFVPAVRTMDMLVIASTVLALVLPLRSLLVGLGRPKTLLFIGLGGIGIQFCLLLVLVPDMFLGVQMLDMRGRGAALALLVTSVYYFFILRYMAWSEGRILPSSRSYKHLVAAVVMIGVMYVFDWLFVPAIDWVALMLLAVVGVAAYSISAYFMGELEASDYRQFRTMLNPQDTFQYVVNELLGKRV